MSVTVTTVGTSLTTIYTATIGQPGYEEKQGFQIVNGSGGQAFNAFQVQGRMHPDAAFVTIKSTSFTGSPSDTYPCWASADPVTLAAGAGLLLEVTGAWYQLRLQASVASGSTTATAYAWGGRV